MATCEQEPGLVLTGSWVLRWDTLQEEGPRVRSLGADESSPAVFFEAESGTRVIFDGYLFDRTDLGAGPADSDASLVASAYERWGDQVLDRLRGGFALAIWDPQQRRLLVGRDAMGLHPCFYWWNDRLFLMSSSLDAILAQPEVDRRFNRVILAEYVQNTFTSHQREETFYESVRRLPPAHALQLKGKNLAVSRYWDPVPPGFAWASEAELSRFQPLLERAVGRCLSVGADCLALSGGFDSVSIAILAAEQLRGNPPLHAVSLRFLNPLCDESTTQTEVARALGMPQLIRTIEETLDGADPVGAALAESIASPSPIVGLFQAMYSGLLRSAAALGLRRMLMGIGGDELFNVGFSYGADRLAALDLRGLWRFYRTWQRTSTCSALQVARAVLWHGAARAEIGRLVKATLPRIFPRAEEWVHRLGRLAVQPWISRGDGDLVASLQHRRWNPRPIKLAPAERSYVRSLRYFLEAPLLLLEMDQTFAWARKLGFTLLYPYFDRDLAELVLRMHPEHLIASGRAKTPLRQMVAERLPSVPMRATKVDFAQMAHEVLRPGGRTAWRILGGPIMLAELGIVDPDRVSRMLEDYFHGRNQHMWQSWIILSAEMWLQARTGGHLTQRRRSPNESSRIEQGRTDARRGMRHTAKIPMGGSHPGLPR
jgi:asparagine synthase (glutamine-hydrolysing)